MTGTSPTLDQRDVHDVDRPVARLLDQHVEAALDVDLRQLLGLEPSDAAVVKETRETNAHPRRVDDPHRQLFADGGHADDRRRAAVVAAHAHLLQHDAHAQAPGPQQHRREERPRGHHFARVDRGRLRPEAGQQQQRHDGEPRHQQTRDLLAHRLAALRAVEAGRLAEQVEQQRGAHRGEALGVLPGLAEHGGADPQRDGNPHHVRKPRGEVHLGLVRTDHSASIVHGRLDLSCAKEAKVVSAGKLVWPKPHFLAYLGVLVAGFA
jgi:hypothetical protein